jgi:uncharacterized protein involved in exopolysaccharide biosynthesis
VAEEDVGVVLVMVVVTVAAGATTATSSPTFSANAAIQVVVATTTSLLRVPSTKCASRKATLQIDVGIASKTSYLMRNKLVQP